MSLRKKFILLSIFIGIAMLAIGFIGYNTIKKSLVSKAFSKAHATLKIHEQHIFTMLEKVKMDATFIANMRPLLKMMYLKTQKGQQYDFWRNIQSNNLLNFSRLSNSYLQIRIIDASGKEIIRVNHNDRKTLPTLVKEKKLQYKGDQAYFLKSIQLKSNQIYISELDLNREGNPPKIIKPIVPTLRVGTPIYLQGQTKAVGIVIINFNAKHLFHDTHFRYSSLSLVNKDGYYLFHKNANKTWRHLLRATTHSGSIFEDDLLIARELLEKDSNVEYHLETDSIDSFVKIKFDSLNKNRYWILYNRFKELSIYGNIRSYIIFIFALAFLALLTYLIFALVIIKESDKKNIKLPQLTKEEKIINKLLKQTSNRIGQDFLNLVVELIAKEFQAKIGFISILLNETTLKTISYYENGKITANISYKIKGTPCQKVYEQGEFYSVNNTSNLFPEDTFLQINNIESYHGVAFSGYKDIIRGHIGLMNDKPLKQLKMQKLLFALFIDRIKSEVLRNQTENELLLARAKAEKANKLKTDFLSQMSHELRTPMNGVIGIAQLLKSSKLDAQQNKYIDTIISSGDSLMKIANDILDLSKFQAGKLKLETIHFDIKEKFDIIFNAFLPIAKEKNLNFTISYNIDSSHLFAGDPFRLQQALRNLISNAVKYTKKGKIEINITGKKNDNNSHSKINIFVTDSGTGIPDSKKKNIFKAFEQSSYSDARKFGGSGLGLSITREIMKALKGSVSLERSTKEGSIFKLSFTLKIDNSKKAPEGDILIFPEEKLSILLVEDNTINIMVAKTMLEKLNCSVDVATNGQIGVDMAGKNKYDCIFMDCQMPVLNGFEATKLIRKNGYQGTIIALTAGVLKENIDKCYESGMNDVLAKPIKMIDLSNKLRVLTNNTLTS